MLLLPLVALFVGNIAGVNELDGDREIVALRVTVLEGDLGLVLLSIKEPDLLSEVDFVGEEREEFDRLSDADSENETESEMDIEFEEVFVRLLVALLVMFAEKLVDRDGESLLERLGLGEVVIRSVTLELILPCEELVFVVLQDGVNDAEVERLLDLLRDTVGVIDLDEDFSSERVLVVVNELDGLEVFVGGKLVLPLLLRVLDAVGDNDNVALTLGERDSVGLPLR